MMRIARLPTADQTWLGSHEFQVCLVAQSFGFSDHELAFVNFGMRMMKRMTPQEISGPSFQKFASDLESKQQPQGPKKFVYILADLTKRLNAIDRYERRALSRRKFAIRELDALRRQMAT